MKRILAALCASMLAISGALAESINVDQAKRLKANGATKLVFATDTNGAIAEQPIAGAKVTGGAIDLTEALWTQIKKQIPADTATKPLLLLKNNANAELARFEIIRAPDAADRPAAEEKPSPGALVDDNGRSSPAATFADCRLVAEAWKTSNPEDWKKGRNVLLVLFNHEARRCYVSSETPAQGDTMLIGLVATSDYQGKADLSQCNREPVQPNVYVSGDSRKLFTTQSGAFGVQMMESRRCWDKDIAITVSVKQQEKSPEVVGKTSINFYERFRGTVQLGVLYTDLHENDFDLRDADGQQVIYDKEADNKGPEYVASLVVYGLPRYFTGDGFRGGYRGRDILNEHGWQDRLGLTFIAGLKDPGDRFGVGLSFELAYGINLVWTKQWFRQRELIGLAEGDPFTGAAADLPTKRDWQSDSSFGLSFDLRYITTLFTGQ